MLVSINYKLPVCLLGGNSPFIVLSLFLGTRLIELFFLQSFLGSKSDWMDYWFWNYNNVLNCKFLSFQVSQDMGIEAPVPISSKMGDTNSVFRRIVTAAEHPHLSIPETEAGRSRKQYNQLVNRSLMLVSGMLVFGTPRITRTWKCKVARF